MSKKEKEKKVEEKEVKKKETTSEKVEQKDEKKKETTSEGVKQKVKEKPKRNMKKILGIALLILIVVGIGGYIGWKFYQENSSVGSDWGDTYYSFMKESKANEKKQSIPDDSKIEFIQIPKVKDPIMVVNYQKDKKNFNDIYFINEDKVENIIELESTDIQFLYNMEEKEYRWYVHKKDTDKETYKPVETVLNDKLKNDKDSSKIKEYTFETDEKIEVDTVDGDKITMTKFDSIFIEPDIEVNTIEYKDNLSKKELKEAVKESIKEYKTTDEMVTENVEKKVKETESAIISKKEEMTKAEEEVQKKIEEEKRKAEEERKRKEEEAKKGLKVGNYNLKYGKYVSDVSIQDSSLYGTLIIRPNGQFHIKANCEGYDYPYKVLDNDGTYKITKIQNSFSYFDGIEFTTDNGVVFGLEVHGDTKLSDQWHGYNYAGSE